MENFTTYVRVDPNNHIELVGTNHIDFAAYCNEVTYLYKDKGVDHFGSNWEHKIDFEAARSILLDGSGSIWLVANDIDGARELKNAGKTLLDVFVSDGGETVGLYLEEYYMGEGWGIGCDLTWNTSYYLTIKKIGTDFTCKVYSDSARTTLLNTLSLTLHADHKFRYIFPANSDNSTDETSIDMEIENLDLQEVAHRHHPTIPTEPNIGKGRR